MHCTPQVVWGKGQYGWAIYVCVEDEDGTLYVNNGEYENAVAFCPFCGKPGTPPPTDAREVI